VDATGSQFFPVPRDRPLRAILHLDNFWGPDDPARPGESGLKFIDLVSLLGRCRPQTGCQFAPTEGNQLDQLATQLKLLSGDALVERINTRGGWLATALERKLPAEQIVIQMYQRALSREPSPREAGHWQHALAREPGKEREVLEDLFWSLLTSREFATNH
jgi:hypothetical protein